MLGFYDVDSRDDPLAPGPDFAFRPRVQAVADGLTRLLLAAEDRGVTIVTRCLHVCGGRTCRLEIEDGTLTVPMDAGPDDVRRVIRARRGDFARVELERRTCGRPEENARRRAFDAFHVNPGASAAVEELGVDRWVVLGTSLPVCLLAAVEGLLALGRDVVVASDAIWDMPRVFTNYAPADLLRSIAGDGPVGPEHVPAFVAAYLERYRSLGASTAATREILGEAAASATTVGATWGGRS